MPASLSTTGKKQRGLKSIIPLKKTTLSNDQLRDAEAVLTIFSRLVQSKTLVDAVNFYGKRFINSSISIKDAKRKWDEEAGRKGLSPDTFRDRKNSSVFEKFGHRKVVDITTGELNSFVASNVMIRVINL